MPRAKRPPTKKQLSFVHNYLTNGHNARQAALNAGYNTSLAEQGLRPIANQPELKAAIVGAQENVKKSVFEEIGATFRARVEWLWRVVQSSIDEEGTGRNQSIRNGLTAIAELNKMAGDYAPDKRLSLNVDLTKKRLEEAQKVYEEF